MTHIHRIAIVTIAALSLVSASGKRAHAQQPEIAQQPAGQTLDFTLNYINQALLQRFVQVTGVACCLTQTSGSVSMNGSVLVYTINLDDTFNGSDIGSWVAQQYIDLASVQGPLTLGGSLLNGSSAFGIPAEIQVAMIPCASQAYCAEQTSSAGDKPQALNGVALPIDTSGNPYKAQDVINAINHLIDLAKAQHAVQLQQQQQQNQTDPFATPH